MDPKLLEARDHIIKAREALRRGDKETARDLGEKAALLTPNLEDAWLILTAADSNAEDALAYAQKALELNPESPTIWNPATIKVESSLSWMNPPPACTCMTSAGSLKYCTHWWTAATRW